MVAVLLRLRFRILANTLQRNTLQLVAVIVGAALTAATGRRRARRNGSSHRPCRREVDPGGRRRRRLRAGVRLARRAAAVRRRRPDPRSARDSLDSRCAPRELMAAMFLVGITWVPGIATIIVSVGIAIAWRAQPASAALAAIVTGLLGAATCVVGSRLTTSVVGSLLRGRGRRPGSRRGARRARAGHPAHAGDAGRRGRRDRRRVLRLHGGGGRARLVAARRRLVGARASRRWAIRRAPLAAAAIAVGTLAVAVAALATGSRRGPARARQPSAARGRRRTARPARLGADHADRRGVRAVAHLLVPRRTAVATAPASSPPPRADADLVEPVRSGCHRARDRPDRRVAPAAVRVRGALVRRHGLRGRARRRGSRHPRPPRSSARPRAHRRSGHRHRADHRRRRSSGGWEICPPCSASPSASCSSRSGW